MSDDQLAMFAGRVDVRAATPPADIAALGTALPAGLRMGTSSWSFPGWAGTVWDRTYPASILAREGLTAYAAHPLLRTVGVDRTFYAPADRDALGRDRDQVPADFRFLLKAPGSALRPRIDGQANPRFLDASWMVDAFLGPVHEVLGEQAGVAVLQFSPMGTRGGAPEAFAEALHRFLDALPADVPRAVEVRDRHLLVPAYAEALAATGTSHVVSVVPGMPTVATQARVAVAARSPLRVVRWMLRHDRKYAEAKAAFAPFDRVVAPHDAARDEIAATVLDALDADVPAWVIANNKAEGSAPGSLLRLARAIVARRPALAQAARAGHDGADAGSTRA